MKLLLTAISIAIAIAFSASAQESDKPLRLNESYGEEFLHYRPLKIPAEKKDTSLTPAPTSKAAPKAPDDKKQLVNVEWLKKNYQLIENRAIDNPSEANVSAYLYTKRIILDKASRLNMAVRDATFQDPLLNENNRVPFASVGAQSVANTDYRAQEQAVREMAEQGGIVIFVDGDCRFCEMQIPVIEALKGEFGLEFLMVSIDGHSPKNFKGSVTTDNGLYKKLGLKLTPSIVYVAKPKGYKDGIDPNTYLIVSQGYYTQQGLVKQLAYAGHHTKLLTDATQKDLKVWERGIASSDDLKTLRLDPDKPETFKQTLQPLLLKQYR